MSPIWPPQRDFTDLVKEVSAQQEQRRKELTKVARDYDSRLVDISLGVSKTVAALSLSVLAFSVAVYTHLDADIPPGGLYTVWGLSLVAVVAQLVSMGLMLHWHKLTAEQFRSDAADKKRERLQDDIERRESQAEKQSNASGIDKWNEDTEEKKRELKSLPHHNHTQEHRNTVRRRSFLVNGIACGVFVLALAVLIISPAC